MSLALLLLVSPPVAAWTVYYYAGYRKGGRWTRDH